MFEYKGKEYNSKSSVVVERYKLGLTSLDPTHKKEIAEELGMTVQTVNQAIQKYIKAIGSPILTKPIKHKVTPSVTQAVKKKVKKLQNDSEPIFINDATPEVKLELMLDPRKIAITIAPNQWGLPVTDPPMYVIDDNYDPDWMEPPENQVEKNWE